MTESPYEIESVVQQHVEEAAHLFRLRLSSIERNNPGLHQVRRIDERLAAQLDGVVLSPELASRFCLRALADPDVGDVFVATVRSSHGDVGKSFSGILAIVEALPDLQPGVLAAFGWMPPAAAGRLALQLLASGEPFHRRIGIGACLEIKVKPDDRIGALIADPDPSVRSLALRVAGECGMVDLRAPCMEAIADPHAGCRLSAARAAVLLGQRGRACDTMFALGQEGTPAQRSAALSLYFQVANASIAREQLSLLARNGGTTPDLIGFSGISGDPAYVPWLIRQMAEPALARKAGEAFSLITGTEIGGGQLEGESLDAGQVSSGLAEEVEAAEPDHDDSLFWPARAHVERWWRLNADRFEAGRRHFLGRPLCREQCLQALTEARQSRRVLAAHYLCLLEPGTPLFATAAPAWRQQRWLAQMQ